MADCCTIATKTRSRRVPARRARIVGGVSVCALALNIVITAFGLPAPVRAADATVDPATRDLLAALAVICTPQGIAQRNAAGGSPAGQAPAQKRAATDCSCVCACSGCAHALMPTAEAGSTSAEKTELQPVPQPRPAVVLVAAAAQPRGPPADAVSDSAG